PTDLCADAAMLVMVGVSFAFLRALATRFAAGLDHRARQLDHELGLPAHDSPCRDADVAAVLAQGDRTQHCRDIGFGAGSIATRGAGLRAVVARRDARDERVELDVDRPRIRLQHLPSMAHDSPFPAAPSGCAVSPPTAGRTIAQKAIGTKAMRHTTPIA